MATPLAVLRTTHRNARDQLAAGLETAIETAALGVAPAAVGLEVDIYTDELGGQRARLVTVVGADESGDDLLDDETVGDLLDEWATVADPTRTEIMFTPGGNS